MLLSATFCVSCSVDHQDLHLRAPSFPTRRSSDLDALGAPKIDDKMRSGETLAVALNKEVLALHVSDESGGVLFFRFGGAWVVVQVDPQLEEGVCVCHRSSNTTRRLTQQNTEARVVLSLALR